MWGVMVAFLLGIAVHPSHAYDAAIKLRNSTLIINNTAFEPTALDVDALAALQFSEAQGGVGLYERADYTSAYITNDTLQLEGGVNPLDSFATVEANNSYLVLNGSTPLSYQALELVLVENNTLALDGADVALNRSTVRLVANNWLHVKNGSDLGITTSRLNFTDWFTWLLDSSAFQAQDAIVSLSNVQTWWNASRVLLQAATLNITTDGKPAPPRYEGKLLPSLYGTNATVEVYSTSWTVENLPLVHFSVSALKMYNTTWVLRNTTAHFYGDLLDFNLTQIYAEDSTLRFFAGTATARNVSGISVFGSNTTAPSALLGNFTGAPLGSVEGELGGADIDIEF